MNVAMLRADCERCAALCCVAFAFDRSEQFAFDKAAGEVCSNLDTCGRCRIHDEKASRGFSGCVRYDCLGAGQRVTQEVFAGQSWRRDPSLLEPMLRAFEVTWRVHELLQLLQEAKKLPLAEAERETVHAFEAALDPQEGWTRQTLASLPIESVALRIRSFLKSLQRHFPAKVHSGRTM